MKAVLYRETGRAVKLYSPLRQGDAVIQRGAARGFIRTSKAWIPDAGDGRIVELAPDQEAILSTGLLLEGVDTNRLLRNAFVSGATGLTLSAGSGTINVDTAAPLLFDTSITPQGLRLTAGNPHVTETRVTWPATVSISANTRTRLWVDHCDRDGTALVYRIQRSVDSKWWRDSDQTWQVAQTDNTLAVSATSSTILRSHSAVIDVGGSNTTLTLSLVLTAGGTTGRRNTVYHVHIYDSSGLSASVPTESSRIVADAASVARSTGIILVRGLDLSNDRGTVLLRVTPQFDTGDLNTTDPEYEIVSLGGIGSGNHSRSLSYTFSGATAIWRHRARSAAGVFVDSTLAGSASSGTTYRVAFRWTATGGELGLASYTSSVFVDGVKGTDVQGASAPSITTNPVMVLGNVMNGPYVILDQIEVRAVVMPDEEIAAWGQ